MVISSGIHPSELAFLVALANCGSLSAAARELGITTPAVSKRLSQMESRLGVSFVTRSTRRMALTPEGHVFVEHARRILADIGELDQLLAKSQATPTGLLRVNATLGFGRLHLAPIISRYVRQFPDVDVQLQLSVSPPATTDDVFDVCIRFGAPPEARVIARRLAANRRLLCASPRYLSARGAPALPHELRQHNCLCIRQGEDAYGSWRLSTLQGNDVVSETIKIRGNLITNDGEIAVQWALDGHGILMRAEWDVARYLRSGRLVQVLAQYHTPDADIYAVYPQRHQLSNRVRTFVDFLARSFEKFPEQIN